MRADNLADELGTGRRHKSGDSCLVGWPAGATNGSRK